MILFSNAWHELPGWDSGLDWQSSRAALTEIQLMLHIWDNFSTSFIGDYLATTVVVLKSRPEAQMKANPWFQKALT